MKSFAYLSLCGTEARGQKNYIFYKIEDPQGAQMCSPEGFQVESIASVRSKQIRGLWFHNDAERIKIENMLEQTMEPLTGAVR